MAQIEKKARPQYLGKVMKGVGVLTLLSIVLPSAVQTGSGVWNLLWYIGIFWGGTVYGEQFIGFINDAWYMPIGVITMVLLIIALIFIAISARNINKERNYKLATGMSLFGSILAIISPIVYYFYLNAEMFWDLYLPVSIFLSIIAGILGIICAIMVGFTSKLRSKSGEK